MVYFHGAECSPFLRKIGALQTFQIDAIGLGSIVTTKERSPRCTFNFSTLVFLPKFFLARRFRLFFPTATLSIDLGQHIADRNGILIYMEYAESCLFQFRAISNDVI
jgi:hypothetical protein